MVNVKQRGVDLLNFEHFNSSYQNTYAKKWGVEWGWIGDLLRVDVLGNNAGVEFPTETKLGSLQNNLLKPPSFVRHITWTCLVSIDSSAEKYFNTTYIVSLSAGTYGCLSFLWLVFV
jgi:hypothetical protein